MKRLPEVTEIQRWKIQPGDRLIIRCEQRLDPATAEMIRERVRMFLQLPDDFPLVIIDSSISLEVAPGP